MSYKLKLDIFEGPLDLLLYLIKKDEINIYDIPIAKVTEQYLQYMELMKLLNLDVVGDFLVMAATLIQIKSRMLLPQGVVPAFYFPQISPALRRKPRAARPTIAPISSTAGIPS